MDSTPSEPDIDFEKNIIAAVKGFPCLYLIDHPHYNTLIINKFAWKHISNNLNKPILECMNKWFTIQQTFLHKLKNHTVFAWPLYPLLKDLQHFMAKSYAEIIKKKLLEFEAKPTLLQKKYLFQELIKNRVKLLSLETPFEKIQEFWSETAATVNSLSSEPQMPIIHWQKFWWDMKVKFSELRSRIKNTPGSVAACKELTSNDYQTFLQFYPSKRNVTQEVEEMILDPLASAIEIGSDRPIHKCKKCCGFMFEKLNYCRICTAISKNYCDICTKNHQEASIVHAVKNWSPIAKALLPPFWRKFSEVSMCSGCTDNINKQSSIVWRICRVCEKNHQQIDNIYNTTNDFLRNVFKEATYISFNDTDGLPGYICKICKIQMQQFNNFYLRFSRAQTRLLEIHRKQFIHIDPPGVQIKSTKTEKPKTYLVNQKEISPPETQPQSTAQPVKRAAEPFKLSITQHQTHLQKAEQSLPEIPIKKLFRPPATSAPIPPTRLNITTTTATTSTPPPPPPNNITSKNFVTVTGNKRTTTGTPPTATIAKRICITNTNTKGLVSLQSHATPVPTKGTLMLKPKPTLTATTASTPTTKKLFCTLPTAGHAPVPLFPKNSSVTIAKRICATTPAVFTISGEQQQRNDQPPVFCIPKHVVSDVSVPPLPLVTVEIPAPKIKTEKLDDGYATPVITSVISSHTPTLSSLEKSAPSPKNIKAIRLDGSTVVMQPNQPTKPTQPSPLVINQPLGFHNEFLSSVFQQQQAKLKMVPTEKIIAPPLPQPSQSRVRKYWGPVDEFQITSVSEKINQKTIHQTPPVPVPFIPNEAPSSSRILPQVEVKEEPEERNESQTAMFYPDSFELNNVSIDADVSSIINNMMTKQEPIDEGESFKYINPSFLTSFVENQSMKREETNKIIDESNGAAKELSKRVENASNNIPQPAENASQTTQPVENDASKTVQLKSLRVKVKRSVRLKNIATQLKPASTKTVRRISGPRMSRRSLRTKNTANK